MKNRQKVNISAIVSASICCLFIIFALIIALNKQYFLDQFTVWSFSPSNDAMQLANNAGLNDKGKFIYRASQPTLDGTQNFNDVCDRVEQVVSILGCYSNSHIYIYDISDPKLDGIREVTAAHEMLHAAYARLSSGERVTINRLLNAEYDKLSGNAELGSKMDFYSRVEPGQRFNELHSVIGTEVSSISPELEQYYAKYFTDRQAAVSYNIKYTSVFNQLRQSADAISSQLSTLEILLKSDSAKYNSDADSLNTDISDFNVRADSGWFDSQSQFNIERSQLSSRVNALSASRSAINGNYDKYNALLAEYNAIASESKKLFNSIDSTLAPAPSI